MKFDCALFDVDGVLIDIRKSYNETIRKTVELAVKMMRNQGTSVQAKSGLAHNHTLKKTKQDGTESFFQSLVTDKLILKFRQSGGFNNDTDTSYAITLALLANPIQSLSACKKYLNKVAESANETGTASVESFLAREGRDVAKFKSALSYPPKNTIESPLARLFDELFYGPELFKKQNKAEPKFLIDKGRKLKPMIRNDRIAISEKTLQILSKQLDGKLAMVTGRSQVATEYSFGKLMKYFDQSACVFLEDEPREHAKPNPYAILRAMEKMHAKTAIYAGDSTEDLLMAKRAEMQQRALAISFVGIYGFSPSPQETLKNFRKFGIEAITQDVNRLPDIIHKLQA